MIGIMDRLGAPLGLLSRACEARASEGARFPHYEAFLAVVETGNLTRAARHLGRSSNP